MWQSAGAAFDEFDTDQSGILSAYKSRKTSGLYCNYQLVTGRQRWLRIFETVDTNGNGCVTVKEFEVSCD